MKKATIILTVCAIGLLAGCDAEPVVADVAAKYTEQTARAIIEGTWHMAMAIYIGAVIIGFSCWKS